VECDGHRWSLATTDPRARADVTVTATVETFVQFVFAPPDTAGPDIDITGDAEAVQRFTRLVGALADVVGRP
jgi:hypothetical protein